MTEGAKRDRDRPRRQTGAVEPITPAHPGSTNEQVVARMHCSGRRLLLPAIGIVAVASATGYLAGQVTEPWHGVALTVGAVVAVAAVGLVPFLIWANRVFVITTRRLVARKGFVTRERRELLHSRTSQVTLRRGPLQTLFGSGTIVVSAAPGDEFVLLDVPAARLVYAALLDLLEFSTNAPLQYVRQPEATRRPFDP